MIGHHLLEGKVAQLPKPLAAQSRPGRDGLRFGCMCDGGDSQSRAVSWHAIAVIKRKIFFSKRPMPVVGRQL
ncbi:hypothetical protein C8R47DRAFT_966586 [Mycena vitilis]|nr:hypothetical protein C8R47DRAFT_966586 [Mycena vitilis]